MVKTSEDVMQNPVVQKIKKTVEKQFQEPDLTIRDHDHKQEMPLSLELL